MNTYKFEDHTEYKAENFIEGVFINPVLPEGFIDYEIEINRWENYHWEGTPYIKSRRSRTPDSTYYEYKNRVKNTADTIPEDEFNSIKEKWEQQYPEGICYGVYCLDGNPSGKPTWWGDFATIAEAVECANNGPEWRRRPRK